VWSELSDHVGEVSVRTPNEVVRGQKPVTAVLLSTAGALLIMMGHAFNFWHDFLGLESPTGLLGFFHHELGFLSSLIVLVLAVQLGNNPAKGRTWGSAIVVFSLLSMLSDAFGGAVIGTVLGVTGGLLAIRWERSAVKSNRLLDALKKRHRNKAVRALEDMDAMFIVLVFGILEVMVAGLPLESNSLVFLILFIPVTATYVAFVYVAVWKE